MAALSVTWCLYITWPFHKVLMSVCKVLGNPLAEVQHEVKNIIIIIITRK